MRLGLQPFLWKWVYLHENEKWFPYQRLSTYPPFETEARGTRKWPIGSQIRKKGVVYMWFKYIYMLFNFSVYSMKLDVKRNWSGVLIVLLWLPNNEQTQFVADYYRWFWKLESATLDWFLQSLEKICVEKERKTYENPNVSRVLPLPQCFKATQKTRAM